VIAERFSLWLGTEHRRLALWLPVFIGCGDAAYFALRVEPPLWVGAVWSALAACLVLVCHARPALKWGAAFLLMAGLGFGAAQVATWRAPPVPALPRRAVLVSGIVSAVNVTSGVDGRASAQRITLRDAVFLNGIDQSMHPLRRTLTIRLRSGDAATPGDHVMVRALLTPVAAPSWPLGRDRQREAWFSGLGGHGYALGPVAVESAARGVGLIDRARMHVADRVTDAVPGPNGQIAALILTGLSAGLSPDVRATYAAAGLSHLLAVAGLHLGIVMGVCLVAMRGLLTTSEYASLRWPCKQAAAAFALCMGAVYVVLSGAHVPALRALGMAAVAFLALATGRRAASLRGLALAASMLLLAWPELIFDVSFQMSFAAVMALIAGFEALRAPLAAWRTDVRPPRRAVAHVITLLMTSVLAGTATLPVVIAHFGTLQPYFVMANLVAVPMMAMLIMPFGLLGLVLMPLGLSAWPLFVMGRVIAVVSWLAGQVASLPAATLAVPAMPTLGLFAFLLGLCWLCLWSTRVRLLGVLPILVGCCSPFLVARPVALIAADGGTIGVVQEDRLLIDGQGMLEKNTVSDWQLALAMRPSANGCADPAACLLAVRGGKVLIRTRDDSDGVVPLPPALCAEAMVVLSATPQRNSCERGMFIDRFSVWRDGAQAVWFERGVGASVVSDRAWRGARPWVMEAQDRGMPNLPMAPAE